MVTFHAHEFKITDESIDATGHIERFEMPTDNKHAAVEAWLEKLRGARPFSKIKLSASGYTMEYKDDFGTTFGWTVVRQYKD